MGPVDATLQADGEGETLAGNPPDATAPDCSLRLGRGEGWFGVLRCEWFYLTMRRSAAVGTSRPPAKAEELGLAGQQGDPASG